MKRLVLSALGFALLVAATSCGGDGEESTTTDRVRNAAGDLVWSPMTIEAGLDPAAYGGAGLVNTVCPSSVWCLALLNTAAGKPLIVEQQRASETQRFDPKGWKVRVIDPVTGKMVVQGIACGTATQCVLVGKLDDRLATVTGSFGAWAKPVAMTDPQGVTKSTATVLVSCAPVSQACVVSGVSFQSSTNKVPRLFVVNTKAGTVGTAGLAWTDPVGVTDPTIGGDAHIKSINCTLGTCAGVLLSQPASSIVVGEGGDDRLVRFEVVPGQGITNLKDAGLGYVNWTSGVTCPEKTESGAKAAVADCFVMAGSTPLQPGTTPTSGKSIVTGFRWDGRPITVARQVISGTIQCSLSGLCVGMNGPFDGGFLRGNNWQSQALVTNSWFDPVSGRSLETPAPSVNGRAAYFSWVRCPSDRACVLGGWNGDLASSRVTVGSVMLPSGTTPAAFGPVLELAGQEGVVSAQPPMLACATPKNCMLATMVTVRDASGKQVSRLAGSQLAPIP